MRGMPMIMRAVEASAYDRADASDWQNSQSP
jgi:hypothetical protein